MEEAFEEKIGIYFDWELIHAWVIGYGDNTNITVNIIGRTRLTRLYKTEVIYIHRPM